MSVRGIVKNIFPESLWLYLQIPYRMGWALRRYIDRKRTAEDIITKAQKYIPYYQDELSREILNDRIEALRRPDENIFLRRAEKEGWKFPGLYGVDGTKYSGAVIVYDKEKRTEHTRELLKLCEWPKKYKFMKLDEFLGGGEISRSDLIIVLMPDWDIIRLKKYIARNNITNDVVYGIAAMREDEQYLDVFSPVDNEVVVDAGAFDGATALRFLKWAGDKIKRVYSFELDPVNFANCEENLRDVRNKVILVKKGTWDKDEVMNIDEGGSGSHLSSDGGTRAELTTIDSVVKDERVTFIKMDVEGAELKSLIGAKNTIIKNRPRLAICVYHKRRDIYEIPEYILSLVPEYKFYLRHYSSNGWETVLYATCE